MWQELRDYWLPMMLFVFTLALAAVLLVLVMVAPLVIAHLSWSNRFLMLFADDATVRRTWLACAVGLVVTAFVFFRPRPSPPSKEPSSKKPTRDTMAGA